MTCPRVSSSVAGRATSLLFATLLSMLTACAGSPATTAPAGDADPARVDTSGGEAASAAEARALWHALGEGAWDSADFLDAFERADWTAFDAERDGRLLETGSRVLAWRAIQRGDGATALRAAAFWADRYGAERPDTVAEILPAACVLGGDCERAFQVLEPFTRHPDGNVAAWAWVHLGDLHCALSDIERARSAWGRAGDVPVSASGGGVAEQAQAAARARLASVGKACPIVDGGRGPPNEWLAGRPVSRETLHGHVVVVLAFDTGCLPCRDMAFRLQGLHQELGGRGLKAVGLLTVQHEGRLSEARGGAGLERGSRQVEIPSGAMRDHVLEFARTTGITYSLGYVPLTRWGAYQRFGRHPVLVVDPDGRIVFSCSGGDDLAYARLLVRRMLGVSPDENRRAVGSGASDR